MAGVMLKKNGLSIKYWSELILLLNYLRNWLSVVGCTITTHEDHTKHKPNIQHLCQICQCSFAQNGKPYTR